ncbi:MAG TPA: DUF4118 domain-containing protein [Candidatus Polarisedimenticolaceae bacterium]|nr:DUF4118 domain-containing protein [Candidatus Polarisedimenticolaceae bacterium]
MTQEDDRRAYLAAGTIGAMLLGMVLTPLRGLTPASNLTFPFIALTIAIAELGGRWPAVATALVSALSLDFFLTQPYRRLTIADKHDVIAFLGLAACGLVAATFSSSRRKQLAALRGERSQLALLHDGLRRLEEAGPSERALAEFLDATRAALPLSALVARNEKDRIVATTQGDRERPVPARVLRPDTLLPTEALPPSLPRASLPLPSDGGRLQLRAGNRPIGWLDVWGSEEPASAEVRRTLSDVGRVVGALLARE